MKTIRKGISLFLVVVMLLCASSLFAQAAEPMYYDSLFLEVSQELLQEYIEENGYTSTDYPILQYSYGDYLATIGAQPDGLHFGILYSDSVKSIIVSMDFDEDCQYVLVDISYIAPNSFYFNSHARIDALNFDHERKNVVFDNNLIYSVYQQTEETYNNLANTVFSNSFVLWKTLLSKHGWYISEIGFANYCPGHTKTLTYDSEDATCSSPGTQTTLCSFCGLILKEETIPASSHQWDNGVVTKPAACGEAGVTTYTCKTCGQTKTETIPAIPHQWGAGVVTKQASCTATGIRTYTCLNCGETKTETIPAVPHQWGAGVVTKQASCIETGVVTYSCLNCGTTRTETTPNTPHTFVSSTTPATTARSGLIVSACSICGEVKSTKQITRIGKVTLSKTSYIYDGSSRTPKVTVKDANGNTISSKYYTVKYSKGRTEIGTYNVKVVFQGRYSGSVTNKFKIVPGRTTDLKGTSTKKGIAKLTWSPVDGAQKYVIYAAESKNGAYEKVATTKGLAYNVKNLSSGTKTYFIVKALTKADGKNYYGTKSNVAAVKIK